MLFETQIKGEKACLEFDLRALEKGGIVSKPTTDVSYDRILDINNRLYRVQVKYLNCRAKKSGGSFELDLRTATRSGKTKIYKEGEVDVLVVYLPKINKLCWLDKNLFVNKQTITLRYLPTKNNQKKGCLIVDDYVW